MTDHRSNDPIELEVKLLLPIGVEKSVLDHPALRGASHVRHEVSTYHDTDAWDLARQGAVLRVRQGPQGRVQTLKLAGSGAFARNEWEWAIDAETPVLALLAETPLATEMATLEAIRPVFSTEVTRTVRVIHREGTTIEVALDLGQIRAGEMTADIRELELELKDGPPLPLYRLAAELHATIPVTLGAESKSARGIRLRTGRSPGASKLGDVDLPANVTGRHGFRHIVSTVLGNVVANLPAAAAGDLEGVHQMRVSLRRLRSALVLFAPYLEPGAVACHGDALRRLGRILGQARDWDVFCTETLVCIQQQSRGPEACGPLRRHAEAARAASHAHLNSALQEKLLTATILGLAAWIKDPVALTGQGGEGRIDRPLSSLAPRLEARLARKAWRRGRHIRQRDPRALHKLRKTLKKLRYGVELLAPVQRPKQVKPLLRRSKALLERLGRINDAGVAVALALELGRTENPALTPAIAELGAWARRQDRHSRRGLRACWHDLRDTRLPR